MLITVKYEYQKKSEKEFVEVKDANTGSKTKIMMPKETWQGESTVMVEDNTTGKEVVLKVQNYLETTSGAIKGSVVVKKMTQLKVIKL